VKHAAGVPGTPNYVWTITDYCNRIEDKREKF
jgi:hypothetical protein